MSADQIFILVLVLGCVMVVAWMGYHSHRTDATRPKPPTAAPPPPPDPRPRTRRR